MSSLTHLSTEAARALALPAEKRIERIRAPRWIGDPRASSSSTRSRWFYNEILGKLFAPFRTGDRVGKKQFQAVQLLKKVGVRRLTDRRLT